MVFDGLAGFVDVRLLADKGMPDQPPRCYSLPVDHGLVPALVRRADEALTTGRACYVVPASTAKLGRARAGSVAETAVILVDLDDGDIAAKRDHLDRARRRADAGSGVRRRDRGRRAEAAPLLAAG